MTPLLRKILGMNWLLVFVMYALLIFGIYMIESSARHLPVSQDKLNMHGSAGAYFAWMQRNWIMLGTVAYFVAALIDYKWIRWFSIPLYVLSLGLMLMAMKADDEVHRLTIAGLSFQPAQLGVMSGIIMIAWLMQDLPKLHHRLGHSFFRITVIGLVSVVPFLLVMKMGDMGSALVWIPVVIVSLIVSGIPFRILTFIGLISAGLLPILYFVVLPMVSERGPDRIDLWLRMLKGEEVDTLGDAYAPHNVSMAVGKAGWTGLGWMATSEQGSLHDKRFIPHLTAHNDFIFAVIAEELGFRGAILMIFGFAVIMIQGIMIAFYSKDLSGRLLVCMVIALFFAHVYENIGMCVLLMPITGIPLPLVSYSGTFVVICMFLMGLIQSVWVHRIENKIEEAQNL